jgi:cobalamin 5'-phosphate synthase/cobalamin synthase
MLKEINNLFSFLTTIPVTMDKDMLTDAAKNMFLFPLIGAFIGLLAGLFGWATFHFLPSLVVGALVLGFLLLITGLHHTDGLLDFGDGVMAHGTPERKIEIMHDQLTGAGGLSLGIMTFLITAFSIAGLNTGIIRSSGHEFIFSGSHARKERHCPLDCCFSNFFRNRRAFTMVDRRHNFVGGCYGESYYG